MSREYHELECDNPECEEFKMTIKVIGDIASCYCSLCGYSKEVDLSKIRSMGASREPGKAFFISGEGRT